LLDDCAKIGRLICRDQRALRIYLAHSGYIIGLGGLLVALSLVLPQGWEGGDFLLQIGGAFVATVSVLPLREYLERHDRISRVRELKEQCDRLSSMDDPPEDDVKRVREILWKVYEKAAVG
jgi:hypothetical protein